MHGLRGPSGRLGPGHEAASDSACVVCRALQSWCGEWGKVSRPTSRMRKLSPGEVEVASWGYLNALEFCREPAPECGGYEKVCPVVRRSGFRRQNLHVGLRWPHGVWPAWRSDLHQPFSLRSLALLPRKCGGWTAMRTARRCPSAEPIPRMAASSGRTV